MSSYPFNGAGSLDVAIFPDIKVVADPVKSPPAWHTSRSVSVKSLSALEAEQWITIRSIFLIDLPFVRFPFLFLRKKSRISNAISKILSIITFYFYRLFIYRYHALMMLIYLPD